jgi:hypothetical protein
MLQFRLCTSKSVMFNKPSARLGLFIGLYWIRDRWVGFYHGTFEEEEWAFREQLKSIEWNTE